MSDSPHTAIVRRLNEKWTQQDQIGALDTFVATEALDALTSAGFGVFRLAATADIPTERREKIGKIIEAYIRDENDRIATLLAEAYTLGYEHGMRHGGVSDRDH